MLRLAPGGDADRAADAARAAVVATVPGLRADAVAVAAAAPPAAAALARVGPFRVTAGSRPALLATLAAALVVIAALATWIATLLYARRRGIRPQ
ncbi:MAG: hypothetical protein H6709_02915 [Kofleriaceae bacterium]|nr:hypothetical protein [Kofleriaceae bacterium]